MRAGKTQLTDDPDRPIQHPRRVVIYARESVDRRGKSPENAARELRQRAEFEGDTVVAVVIERGSASRHARKERERWPEVAALITGRKVDMLMTTEFSRATRELGFYVRLRDACVEARVLWSYGGTVFDMSRRGDRFRTGLDALRAEDEADEISERSLRGHRGGAARGRPQVGSAPWGYRRTYDSRTGDLIGQEPDPVTAPIVRSLADRILAGESLTSLVRELTKRGVPTPRKGEWTLSKLKQVMLRPALAGMRVHQGQVVGEGEWEPILTPDQHYELVEKLNDPARKVQRDGAVKHLLTGLGRCGVCKAPLRFVPHIRGPKYQCGGHYCVMRDEGLVDEIVRVTITKRLGKEDAAEVFLADNSADIRAARDELAQLKIRLEQCYQQAEAEDEGERLSPAGLARMERTLLPKIEDAEKRVAALRTAQSPLVARMIDGDPEQVWEELTVAQRRDVIRAVTRGAYLDRARFRHKPDVEAVRVLWLTPEGTSAAAAEG